MKPQDGGQPPPNHRPSDPHEVNEFARSHNRRCETAADASLRFLPAEMKLVRRYLVQWTGTMPEHGIGPRHEVTLAKVAVGSIFEDIFVSV